MDTKKIAFLLCILAAIEIHGVEVYVKGKKTIVVESCDSFENITDYSVKENVESIQSKVFYGLWNMTSTTSLGNDLYQILESMFVKNKVPFWRRYAIATSEGIFTYLPVIKEIPHFCGYAQLINATVEFEKTKNCPAILKAIKSTADLLSETSSLITENGIKFAGCAYCARPVTLASDSCYQFGLVYSFEEIWELLGSWYPCELKSIVKKMYYSSNFYDRFIALMATVNLSKYYSVMEYEYNVEILYQKYIMYSNGKVPKFCCDDYVHEARKLFERLQSEDIEVLNVALKYTGCKK